MLRWPELIKVTENNRLEDGKTLNVTILFDSSSAQLEELLTFKNEDLSEVGVRFSQKK